jgi:hypothetical protein
VELLEDRRLLSITVDTLLDENNGIGIGSVSLRDAIVAAAAGETIDFSPNLTSGGPATITLTHGQLTISKSLTINGPGAGLLTVDASGNDPTPDAKDGNGSRVFFIDDATDNLRTVLISGLTLTGGDVRGGGGAILARENLTVADSVISGNAATTTTGLDGGGGIYSRSASGPANSLTVHNSSITGNTDINSAVNIGGGGILKYHGRLVVDGSTISDNTAPGGGGISFRYGTALTVTGTTVSGNSARSNGGGILIHGSNPTVTFAACSISNNSATYYGWGGGIYQIGGTLSVSGCTISGNSAPANGGGGIRVIGVLTVSDSSVNNNTAVGGGGIAANGSVSVTDSVISENSAEAQTGPGGFGGGISVFGDLTVTRSVIKDNTSDASAGGMSVVNGDATIVDSSIRNNSAGTGGKGGGLFMQDGDLTITGSTFTNNSAGDDGGGIWSFGGSLTVTQSTISANTSAGDGAGFHLLAPSSEVLSIRHSTVADNASSGFAGFGGGVFLAQGTLELDHTIVARNSAHIGPDLTGLIGAVFAPTFSLIGNNAASGLLASPVGGTDANGNRIGGPLPEVPLQVSIEFAAMGDFEAGPGGDSFLFEYSIDGGPFQSLFTTSVDEARSHVYSMDRGTQVVLNDPMFFNGFWLVGNSFQRLFSSTTIPGDSAQVAIRFTATNDGPAEAFAWRNLVISRIFDGTLIGSAVTAGDVFAHFQSDPDYTIAGDMFGIRSRSAPGIPGLPADIVDDSKSVPSDVQGIIRQNDLLPFFGVVDTVNGVGNDTNVATWTFNNVPFSIDPKLSYLVENGLLLPDGSRLQTHVLLDGSPAIDAGDPAAVAGAGGVPELDQRGVPYSRVFGDRIDIGAVERQTLQLVVDTLSDEDDADHSPGDFSLREALELANRNLDVVDSVEFDADLAGGTIRLGMGELVIADSVTVTGLGEELLTIDASGNDPTPDENNGDGSRVLNISSNNYGVVDITGLTITGGDSPSSGGGILSGNTELRITGSTISGNSARFGGGGVASYSKATVMSSKISNNSTTYGKGGGILAYHGLTITDSTISDNSASSTIPNIDGTAGGGVFASQGDLTVTRSTISGNTAGRGGGIYTYFIDNTSLIDSTVSGNSALEGGGGGVFNGRTDSLHVIRSTISANSATGPGGGMFTSGTVDVLNSTISGNSADGDGGGIHVELDGALTVTGSTIDGNTAGGDGGGVHLPLGHVTVTSSTISGNSAPTGSGGGLYLTPARYAELAIRHSTIAFNSARNGGGIMLLDGTLTLDHTIVARNSARFGVDLTGLIGSVFDATFSLIGYNEKSGLAEAPVAAPDANGNRIGGPMRGLIDPGLESLQDYGGATRTHALLGSSLALNAGNPSAIGGAGAVPGSDQRGAPFVRVASGRIDIGAYERQIVSGFPLLVDTTADESDGDYSSGDFSLREAIGIANGSPGTNTIGFAAALTSGGPATITLSRGELLVRESLTIQGSGPNLLTVDASGNDPTPTENNGDGSRVFVLDDNDFLSRITVQISGLTLTGGDVDLRGGAIVSSEHLILTSSRISGNAAWRGGGIYSRDGNLSVSASIVSGNASSYGGGGIWSHYGNLSLTDSVVQDNRAMPYGVGGGIHRIGNSSGVSAMTVTSSFISGNSAGHGGGISGRYGSLTVSHSIVSDNSSGGAGGGILHRGNQSGPSGVLTVANSTVSGNSAGSDGGGIYNYTAKLTVTNSTISGNVAGASGGGIAVSALFSTSPFVTSIRFSTITDNEAPDGQGSGVASRGNLYILTEAHSSIIAGNVHSDVDFVDGTNSFQSNGYNLIGTGNAVGKFVQPGDQTGITNPLVGPLADNGGPTRTHALLPGSPAIDSGNPGAEAGVGNVPQYDQRGEPFTRVHAGRIDIGAFELQPIPPAMWGDFNGDGAVDAADYVVWRKSMGRSVSTYAGADGSGNGAVDHEDYGVWTANLGRALPTPTSGPSLSGVSRLAEQRPSEPTTVMSAIAISIANHHSSHQRVATPLLSHAALQSPTQGKTVGSAASPARTALRAAAVDAAISDLLLVLQRSDDQATRADDPVPDAVKLEKEFRDEGEETYDVALTRHVRPASKIGWSSARQHFRA